MAYSGFTDDPNDARQEMSRLSYILSYPRCVDDACLIYQSKCLELPSSACLGTVRPTRGIGHRAARYSASRVVSLHAAVVPSEMALFPFQYNADLARRTWETHCE